MEQKFQIQVNEVSFEISCEPERTLLNVLREDLRLTGTKRGCDIGVCGSCTVLIDGKPSRSCIIKMKNLTSNESQAPRVITIEGLGYEPRATSDPSTRWGSLRAGERRKELHPIQQAFIDCGAIQCGFCTPGMVLAAKALLDSNPKPTRDEIKKALAGNLCRCTGYQQIFEAIEAASKIYP